MKFTEHESVILQKLIRNEKRGAYELPHLDQGYVDVLDKLYLTVGHGVDYWEGYKNFGE